MPTRQELKALSELRLKEAEALFGSGLYDGTVYLAGYVIELALKALTSLEEHDQAIAAQWHRRIERARYEADLAERRYEAVDPANRLIAATLESPRSGLRGNTVTILTPSRPHSATASIAASVPVTT